MVVETLCVAHPIPYLYDVSFQTSSLCRAVCHPVRRSGVVRLCEAHALAVAPRGKALLLLLLGKDDLLRDASVLTDGEVSTVGAQTVR